MVLGLVHCDLNLGNILIKSTTSSSNRSNCDAPANCIDDFGLSQPANITSSIKSSGIYGVVRGKPYTPANDGRDKEVACENLS